MTFKQCAEAYIEASTRRICRARKRRPRIGHRNRLTSLARLRRLPSPTSSVTRLKLHTDAAIYSRSVAS
jgi:hypothetical protein